MTVAKGPEMTPYYQDDLVTIYHGDARDVLPAVGRWDVVVTDPPYGVMFDGKNTKHTHRSGSGYRGLTDGPAYIDDVIVPIVTGLVADGRRAVITPGLRSMFRYPEPKAVGSIFYPSGAGMGPWGFTCSQPIFYYGKDPYLAASLGSRPDSFSSTESVDERIGHPCPKPIGTMRWLVVKASLPGETILDPFMGSGTTLVAAKEMGRRAIGIELDEAYCEVAAQRCSQEVLGLA